MLSRLLQPRPRGRPTSLLLSEEDVIVKFERRRRRSRRVFLTDDHANRRSRNQRCRHVPRAFDIDHVCARAQF